MKISHKKRYKKITVVFLAGLAAWLTAGYLSARYLTKEAPAEIPEKKYLYKQKVRDWSIASSDRIRISAWFIRKDPERVVILLAGVRGNRLSQIKRAELYLEKGFSVLMPDLRATGKSEGDIISFGWHERNDLIACVRELKKKGFNFIGVHGQSLGAAAIAYSLKEYNNYDFIIMESCYDTINNAFKNRVAKYHLPYFLFIPVILFTENILKTDIHTLSPAEYIKKANNLPILFMAGDSEDQLKMPEIELVYTNCSSRQKSLYIFKGGKHVDFLNKFPVEYKRVWKSFVDKNIPLTGSFR
ncbi:MAG: alpha/beta hydrolase [bacterium]|nr:alpha/beta hydrolase [bacterium]